MMFYIILDRKDKLASLRLFNNRTEAEEYAKATFPFECQVIYMLTSEGVIV